MKRINALIIFAMLLSAASQMHAGEFHVSVNGNDRYPGTKEKPLLTIQRAANLARPGDTITVYSGIYREYINPPRGGESDSLRIVYRAAPGEKVEIRGSEVVNGWEKVSNDVWKVMLKDDFFGNFNPFTDIIHGDWFNNLGRTHHTAAVYLNGEWLTEANNLDEMLMPGGQKPTWLSEKEQSINLNLWFAKVQDDYTTVWAQFPGVDPNKELVEVNVRQSVFYPDKPGCNYITVDGFILRHAATPWAPPTAEQIGLIGTHWSKGWVIENCHISHSACTGISLGKYGDERDNKAGSATGYVTTIQKALAYDIPWNREHIGSHVVRNNHIHHCEQAGIVGSMGAAYSTIENNIIDHIHTRRLFTGAEMSGIKIHGAINTLIRGNMIHNCIQGIWLDWMGQNAQISGNLLFNNIWQDIYLEVNHGPLMVDNNIMLSDFSVWDMSEGSAFAHNLFAGRMVIMPERGRNTPYHRNNETNINGLAPIRGGDDRFYNNIFIGNGSDGSLEKPLHASSQIVDPEYLPKGMGYGLWVYNEQENPLQTAGNVYLFGARPFLAENFAVYQTDTNPGLSFDKQSKTLIISLVNIKNRSGNSIVNTAMLGKPKVTEEQFIRPDGKELMIDTDYFGKKRNHKNPTPGPFENIQETVFHLNRWK